MHDKRHERPSSTSPANIPVSQTMDMFVEKILQILVNAFAKSGFFNNDASSGEPIANTRTNGKTATAATLV